MNSELADVLNSHTAGYSREEMLILQCDPLGERSPLQLKPISENVCEQIPLFRQIYRLLEILYTGGEIKLTRKGNLPLKVVQEISEFGVPGYGTAGGTGNYSTNAIFRDPGSSRYYFYAMDLDDFSLAFSADISSYTGIAQATAFAWARRGPLAYYASGGTIYQIKYNYEAKTVEGSALAAWDGLGDGESITALKMCPHPGRNLPGGVSARDKYLFVGAYNESMQEGKVYVLGVNLETDGSLVAEPVAVYEGFGRIKGFGFKF